MAQPTALITGTSTGFGFETAKLLSAAGFRVFGTMRDIAGRNAEPRRELEALGVTVVELDVTNQSSVDRGIGEVLAAAGRLNVVVNNAGTAHMGVTEAFSPESFSRQLDTNVIGPARIARAVLPTMREQKSGLVIFVSSVVGRMLFPFTGVYSASKWAIEAYAESLSYELRPFGVDIALVEPGAYATNIFSALITPDDTARVAEYGATAEIFQRMGESLAKESGDPREVAEAIVALARQAPGTRELRTVVPAEHPAAEINRASAPIQREALEAFGLGALLAPDLTAA